MHRVFVLSNTRELVMPCMPSRARRLLKEKKASVYSMRPFTIILNQSDESMVVPKNLEVVIDTKASKIVVIGHFETGPVRIYESETVTGVVRQVLPHCNDMPLPLKGTHHGLTV